MLLSGSALRIMYFYYLGVTWKNIFSEFGVNSFFVQRMAQKAFGPGNFPPNVIIEVVAANSEYILKVYSALKSHLRL